MAFISGASTISYTDLYASFTEVPGGLNIGQYVEGPQGKWFRLVGVGASALVVGNVIQSVANNDTQFHNMTVAAASITTGGLQTVTVTNGTTTVAANDFLGGSVTVFTTPDLGSEYTIMGHTTGGSGATLTLTLDRPLRTAWTTATKINMKKDPWNGTIQAPTSLTGPIVGVAIYAIPSAAYGFIQTHGVSGVLADNAAAINTGQALTVSANVAGAALAHTYANSLPYVGMSISTWASGATNHVIPAILGID